MNINTLCPFDGLPLEANNKPFKSNGEEYVTVRCLAMRHWISVPLIDLEITEEAPY